MERKIIIPENGLYRTYRDYLLPTEEMQKNQNFISPFKDPNSTYILNINSQSNKKHKHFNHLNLVCNLLNKLDIVGNIEMNINDVDFFEYTHRPESFDESYGYRWYSNSDLIKSKKLTMNNPLGAVSFNVWNGQREYLKKEKLEELIINAQDCKVSIEESINLKKITLNNSLQYNFIEGWNGRKNKNPTCKIRLKNCPNIEEVNLSNVAEFDEQTFSVEDINPDCKFIFNKKAIFKYDIDPPQSLTSLNCFAKYSTNEERYNTHPKVDLKLSELFPISKNNTIEVTFNELQYKLSKLANEQNLKYTKLFTERNTELIEKNYNENKKTNQVKER